MTFHPVAGPSHLQDLMAVRELSTRVTLSRFVSLRPHRGAWLLECPLATHRVVLHSPVAVQLVVQLSGARSLSQLARALRVPLAETRAAVSRLHAAGFTERAPRTKQGAEALAMWEPHDLTFHTRSRLGLHGELIGGAFPFRDVIPSLPAVKPGMRHELSLPRPPHDVSRKTLADVLARRRSKRLSRRRLTLEQLSDFLYLSSRVRGRYRSAGRTSYEITKRPHPSGGACYPLELYLAIGRCAGLLAGLYHYDPVSHRLGWVNAPANSRERVLETARVAMAVRRPPQVVIVYAARFGRVAWKYRGMAYATILKDVGALLQTMYLVATDLGLSACALGCGDSAVLAGAIGEPWFVESSVGEMALGG
jgi:SagB-type dehydrogenase family enzyme